MISRVGMPLSQERKLYMRAIELLNENFKRRGLIPTIGMEMEFYVTNKNDRSNGSPLPDKLLAENYFSSFLNERLKSLDISAPIVAGPVDRFYEEVKRNKYEVTSVPLFANQAVEALEQIRAETNHQLLSFGGEYSPDEQQRIRQQYIFNVSRNSHLSGRRLTPGLHTSLGFLCAGEDGYYDVFQGEVKYMPDSPQVTNLVQVPDLAEAMNNSNPALMLLFAPRPESYVRYAIESTSRPNIHKIGKSWFKTNSSLRFQTKELLKNNAINPEFRFLFSSRIENRLPGADTPIYKAVLGTLLSGYAGMLEAVEVNDKGEVCFDECHRMVSNHKVTLSDDKPIATNIHDAAKDFEAGRRLWDLLDQLSPEEKIGTRIYEHELARYRRIAEYSAEGERIKC